VGRREVVGGSGIHPISAGTAPGEAEARTEAGLVDRARDGDARKR
jgi:hypothetical protein